ncbi:MAG: sarcosine oxidase subunit delta [Pseudomonadota bacterium]
MRLTCPLCGDRDHREFYYYGASDYLRRPGPEADDAAWDNYLHLRDNPAGVLKEVWQHEYGCASWIEVTRNTVTHEVLGARLVADRGAGGPDRPRRARRAAKGGEA